MTGTETKITIDDIRSVAKALCSKGGNTWDEISDANREECMLLALNAMFTQEEQNQIIRGLSAP